MSVKYSELPTDLQDEIYQIAKEFPLSLNEVTHYYLMGGENTERLCSLKIAGVSERVIEFVNDEYWQGKWECLLLKLNKRVGMVKQFDGAGLCELKE